MFEFMTKSSGTIGIVFSWLWVFVKPVLLMLLDTVTKETLELARNVVEDMSKTDFSNAEKRAVAFGRIKDMTVAAGKNVSDSTINLLIELAYKMLKARS